MDNIIPPRLYVNGFPKSGLHLAMRMTLPLFQQAREETVWFGTNAWTTERHNLDNAVDYFEEIEPGELLMGHTGYMPELKDLFNTFHILMLLVYRDLRDVAISQTYHILDDQGGMLNHPWRDRYSTDFDEALLQVIEGMPELPGVVERWETYMPWMELPFVQTVRFEDMIKKPHWAAKRFFEWIYMVAILQSGYEAAYIDKDLKQDIIKGLVFEMGQRHLSPTFRKGKTGSWKREFKPEHVKAFKKTDPDNVLMKLGYVKKEDW